MATTTSSHTIFQVNPYEGHPSLTELEAEVLWEYAKLSQNLKEVREEKCSLNVYTDSSVFPVDSRNASVERCSRRDPIETTQNSRNEDGPGPHAGQSFPSRVLLVSGTSVFL